MKIDPNTSAATELDPVTVNFSTRKEDAEEGETRNYVIDAKTGKITVDITTRGYIRFDSVPGLS